MTKGSGLKFKLSSIYFFQLFLVSNTQWHWWRQYSLQSVRKVKIFLLLLPNIGRRWRDTVCESSLLWYSDVGRLPKYQVWSHVLSDRIKAWHSFIHSNLTQFWVPDPKPEFWMPNTNASLPWIISSLKERRDDEDDGKKRSKEDKLSPSILNWPLCEIWL